MRCLRSLLAIALFATAAIAQGATKIHWYGQAAFRTVPLLAGTPAQFKAALEKRGLGARMVEMKPGEDRSY